MNRFNKLWRLNFSRSVKSIALLFLLISSSYTHAIVIATDEPTVAACCFGNELDVALADGRFGRTNVRTIGQTFVAPTDATNILDFTFWLQDFNSEGAGLQFQAYIMDWDSSAPNGPIASGPILYQSDVRSGSTSTSLERYTFDITTGVEIESGNDYVIFLSTLNFDSGDSRNAFGTFTPSTDAYLDGTGVVFIGDNHQDEDLSAILNPDQNCITCWIELSPYQDLAFEVTFGSISVPEPSTVLLLVIGIASIGWKLLRKTEG